jgi:CRP-like cAMP-binding protein
MPKAKARRVQRRATPPAFDAEDFLTSAGAARRVATYPRGKIVFSQGQPSDAVMYIQKGSIKISVLSRNGKEAVVAMLGPGDFFGELALILRRPRTATVTLTAPSRLLSISAHNFRPLLMRSPEIQFKLLEALAERLTPTAT